MHKIYFLLIKSFSKLFRNKNLLINYYRHQGINIGNNVNIFSDIVSSEPYLISIGDNSTISTNVTLLTHDASIGALLNRNVYSDLIGEIKIGANCFIGSGAIILYGVSLANNIIVAAGSVVTKSFNEENLIIGGNPAKIIGKTDDYINKNKPNFFSLHKLSKKNRKKQILSHKKKWITK